MVRAVIGRSRSSSVADGSDLLSVGALREATREAIRAVPAAGAARNTGGSLADVDTTPMLDTIAALAHEYRTATDDEHKKEWGQFFTSTAIASFMARMVRAPTKKIVRVLDPGAGTGVLGLALAERLIVELDLTVELTAVEKEPGAAAMLRLSIERSRERLGADRLRVKVIADDFLDLDQPKLGQAQIGQFDVAIANPPYFKMSPNDERGGDAPNAYARFMEVAARTLVDGGALCFIIPRSFSAGYYFRAFRRRFHRLMRLDRVHVFESRKDAFKSDGVLQENIIVAYTRSCETSPAVTISSSSSDRDFADAFVHDAPRSMVIDIADQDAVLSLPSSERDMAVLRLFAQWKHTLSTYQLDVSTGPVVPFRSEGELRSKAAIDTLPLLWLQHVLPGRVVWPVPDGFRKPEHIVGTATNKLLVDDKTYVLLRRFSAKEDERRLVSAPYIRGSLGAAKLGIENHVNYVYRRAGELTEREARALSALFNSALFDSYFRISNGNTQVSATELRALPLPGPEILDAIADRLTAHHDPERAVTEVLGDV
jgi:adenine-specific DNA-methyltransferase